MSFWFKNKPKPANPNALPPASRDGRSSDSPLPVTGGGGSQIPTLNGVSNASSNGSKPGSPTIAQTQAANVNNSLDSVAGSEGSRPGTSASKRPHEERTAPSPEQKSMREQVLRGGVLEGGVVRNRSQDENQPARNGSQEVARQRAPVTTQPQTRSGSDPSPYPWSTKTLNFTVAHTTPFPRYGAAVNATASRDGSIYIMGGLINGSTVKGDLWMVEAGSSTLTCYPVATTSEGPGPRVGHASLLVGNAFIVFGGDTKMDEGDSLDDTLYLLNTSTKQWSRALPAGARPPGRYGHTLNILGSKIYIFGGQVEGYFFNDLVAFDLNALQQASNRWDILIQNTIDGGPPHGQIPPARTNHTMVSWGDKLYLFGGTDGVHWFNDCWSYSPHTNSWTQLECIGYIPSPREGHAAALVGDVMYIFGGRNEEGNDLGDLAAFRINTKRWYTFQNMGPSPSARSGHSMTTVGKTIVVLAGEPSSAPRNSMELANVYFLDTAKIRYPPAEGSAQPQSSADAARNPRRPSGEKNGGPLVGVGRGQQSPRELDRERTGSGSDLRGRAVEPSRSESNGSRLPQATRPLQQLPAPTGPPPQPPAQQQNTSSVPSSRQPTRPERALSPRIDAERGASSSPQLQVVRGPSQQNRNLPASPSFPPDRTFYDNDDQDQPRMYKPQTYQPS